MVTSPKMLVVQLGAHPIQFRRITSYERTYTKVSEWVEIVKIVAIVLSLAGGVFTIWRHTENMFGKVIENSNKRIDDLRSEMRRDSDKLTEVQKEVIRLGIELSNIKTELESVSEQVKKEVKYRQITGMEHHR